MASDCSRVFTGYAWKIGKKGRQRIAGLQIVDQRLQRNARPSKHRSPAQSIGRCRHQRRRDAHARCSLPRSGRALQAERTSPRPLDLGSVGHPSGPAGMAPLQLQPAAHPGRRLFDQVRNRAEERGAGRTITPATAAARQAGHIARVEIAEALRAFDPTVPEATAEARGEL